MTHSIRLSPASDLRRQLYDDGILLGFPSALGTLRREVTRIASTMDAGSGRPPMLWSGVPLPGGRSPQNHQRCLSVSVGGTSTKFMPLCFARGSSVGLDENGKELPAEALASCKERFTVPTPTHVDVESGQEMLGQIVDCMAARLRSSRSLRKCGNILLSWSHPARTVRTRPEVLGGISAYSISMSKEQAAFSPDLVGRDIGKLFEGAFFEAFGWRCPVTVVNDSVMALHYFLTPENRARFSQIGLFVNGTGSNFCLAEPYAVRAEGVVSESGDTYEPRRVTCTRPVRSGETVQRFFVNYEVGSIDLGATRTRFDLSEEYQIEKDVLSGSALREQFRRLVAECLGRHVLRSIGDRRVDGSTVSRIASTPQTCVSQSPWARDLSSEEREGVLLIARSVLARSALHAALILSAVTRRTGFGLGSEARRRPDLLGLEGSVWKTRGYASLVRHYWQSLVAPARLRVETAHESDYDASLLGPAHVAAQHATKRVERV